MHRVLERLERHAGLHLYRVFTRRLGEGSGIERQPGIDYRVLSEADLVPLCRDAELDLAPDKVRSALARGELCVAAFDHDQLVGYAWFAFASAPHVAGVWVDFDPRAVYTYKSFVRPAYRGRRIAAALYVFADAICMRRGRSLAIICVAPHNRASIAAAERCGFRATGYTAYLHWRRRLASLRSAGLERCALRFHVPRPSC